jgi:UDPglucose 6-dehydrogenase
MARKVITACGGSVRGKTIALLGLTFKPNTDDLRNAPSLALIQALQDNGALIRAFDPVGIEAAVHLLDKVSFAEGPYDTAAGADALVIATEWDAFRALDFDRLKTIMKSPVLIDLHNIYQPEHVARSGFSYTGIGRPLVDGRPSRVKAAE